MNDESGAATSAWVSAINRRVLAAWRTRLRGGFDEPFYRARCADGWSELQFRSDWLPSAMHELAHWLVAGAARRRRDDFGYWYEGDGRDAAVQERFFAAEVRPQATEWAIASAAGRPFRLSCDNLAGLVDGAAEQAFAAAVHAESARLLERSWPRRLRCVLAACAGDVATARRRIRAAQVGTEPAALLV